MKVYVHKITISNPHDPTRQTIEYLGGLAFKDEPEAVNGAKRQMESNGVLRVEVLCVEAEPVKVYDTELAPEAMIAGGI